jgi:hypothetical protein
MPLSCRRLILSLACLLAAGLFIPAAHAADPTPEQLKFFETKVRPLLLENCTKCHGDKKQKGHLRLDSLDAALKGGDTAPALVPGDPAKSLLVKAIGYQDEKLQMPPDDKLADEQIQVLTDWVAMGAPWPKDGGAIASTGLKGKKRTITDQDRQFWSFQPVKDSAPPMVADANKWCRNAIDQFILAKLQQEGLTPAPEADRVTLIRRATFDLHGLPPTPEEVEAFVNDKSPDAYEKLIDRLLASPHYGERYARHWLDLVRYAESDGFKQDAYRANAYPYRDWVIAAFNKDKPYDQFVREQLAGDEIAPNDSDARVATGYLRAGIYEYNQRNAENQWSEYLNDLTDVTADTFIGMSMGCARCHDHKFDPILQADYFRLQSFFQPVLPRNDLPRGTPEQLAKFNAAQAKWDAKTAKIRAEIAQLEAQARKNAENRVITKFPPAVLAMMQKPAAERTPYEKQIAYLVYRQVDEELAKTDDKIKGKEKERLVELRKELSKFDDEKPKALPTALCVTDVGPTAPPTIIPGDKTKTELTPGYLTVLDQCELKLPKITPTSDSTGRRTALANWITQPSNPLTTRVIANRIWQWHFGRGIVKTSSDYGKLGEAPTHPELLDWLTSQFVKGTQVSRDAQQSAPWTMKAMHRLIMTSATYRQAGVREMPQVAKLKDPENRWLWRMNPRRLDAEQIRDAMLAVSGELKLDHQGGPSAEYTEPTRTIYTKIARNSRDPMLDVFDAPETYGSVAARNATTTANQSLLMINGDWPLKRAAAFAQRVLRESPSSDPGVLVDRAFNLAYGRNARPQEKAAMVAFLNTSRGNVTVASSAQTPAAVAGADVNDQPITQVMPQVGGQAILLRSANPADMLKMPKISGAQPLFGDHFTVEAYVMLESIYENASVRVIASQWNNDKKTPGWSLGVTSEKSAFLPRNLILQLFGDESNGRKGGYEVVASNLRLELHKVYYVGVAVDLTDTSEKGITFWLKDVGDMDAPLRTAHVKHTVTGSVASTSPLPLIVGGTDSAAAKAPHGWDGLIGELRICNEVLKPEQNLWNDGDAKAVTKAYWKFEETPGFLKDSTGKTPDLIRGTGAMPLKSSKSTAPTPAAKVDAALIDLCHVLLNSNEFLYVD